MKSVFTRLLLTYMLVIIMIMGVLVTTQASTFSKEYMDSRINELEEEASFLAKQIQENQATSTNQTYIPSVELLTKKYDALVWVLDTNGKVIMTQKQHEEFLGKVLPDDQIKSFLNPVIGGEIKVSTKLYSDSSSKNPVISVGAPIYKNDDTISSAVIIHVPETMLSSFSSKVNTRLFEAFLISIFVALVFVVLVSRTFTKPLGQIYQLAKQAEMGNFAYRVNITSDSEFKQIGDRLNKMMARLAKTEHLRTDFVQNASHELKAPITVISGYCQAMSDSHLPEEKRQEYIKIIKNETERMDTLINGLMHLSRIESGSEQLNLEHFNINDLISQKVLSFEFEIRKKNMDVELNYESDKLEVIADKAKIERVLINLIQNAIKYTSEGDSLIITTKQIKAKAYIEIKDTGVGIDQGEIDNIFERFYTVDKAKTPGKTGTGIGLSLVKRILQLHNSDIYVESVKGEYSKFYFYLDM